jgi:hypothetical protein
MLEFYLAAIQFALGDLEAPTAPSNAAPRGNAPGGRSKPVRTESEKVNGIEVHEEHRVIFGPASGGVVDRHACQRRK